MKPLFALLILSALNSTGQKLLFHKNNRREMIYQKGEVISLQLNHRKNIAGTITGFTKNGVIINNDTVDLSQVRAIYVDKKTRTWFILRYKYKTVLPVIGVGYAGLDFVNTGELKPAAIQFASVMVGAGLLAKLLISERIKIKKRRKLVVLHAGV